MKKITIPILILLAVVLSSCHFPGYEDGSSSESDDAMATEISRILTGTPVQIEVSPTLSETDEETIPVEETEEIEGETETPTETQEPEPTEEEEEETATATTTPTPTDTPTETPTATLSSTDPVSSLGEPDWVDDMDTGDQWPTGYNEYTTIVFEDGYLKLSADTELDGWRLTWPVLDDFYLEAEFQTPDCSGNDHFGLIFRVPENANANKGYLFGITCDGRYSLRRWNGQNMFHPVEWTASDSINEDESGVNKLGVMAEEEKLTLYINGEKVKEITDDAYLSGNFGIFIGGTNTEDLSVRVNQIRYWKLP